MTCIELNSACDKISILCTATDVGIYGLLASQSCYHSMVVPCWFTLWTSSRFLHHYILLISIEIFLISCLCPFFFFSEVQFNIMHVLSRLCSTISLLLLLLMSFLLQLKIDCHISSPTHTCSAHEPRPHLFVDTEDRL